MFSYVDIDLFNKYHTPLPQYSTEPEKLQTCGGICTNITFVKNDMFNFHNFPLEINSYVYHILINVAIRFIFY